jgi:hypothetical protein
MKNLFKKAANKIKSMFARAKAALAMAKLTLASNRAEGFVDSGIKILIAVVIGALLLAGLYALFGDTILPTLTKKIKDLFSYSGA